MRLEQVAEFRRRLNEYAGARLSPADFRPQLSIDAPASFSELNDASVAELLSLAPFGFGNSAPLLTAFDVEVCGEPTVFKEKHLRVRFRQEHRSLLSTAWNFAERLGEFTPGRRLDMAFCLEEDSYGASRGWAPWRVVLKDIRATASES